MSHSIPLRQRHKEKTRQSILSTACVLFGKNGYERTTMRDVAAAAGVGLGTIFTHFPDKPSLLVAAYREDLGAVIAEALAALPASGLVAQLAHLTRRIYEWYAANPLFSRALVKEALFLDSRHGKDLDDQLETFLGQVHAMIMKAAASGDIPPETNPALGTQAFGAFYIGSLLLGLKQPVFDVEGETGRVAALCQAYFRGTAPVCGVPGTN